MEYEHENLNSSEREQLENMMNRVAEQERLQVKQLIDECHNRFQFAKTHSTLLKDWEEHYALLEKQYSDKTFPPGVSPEFHQAIMKESAALMKVKFETIREAFQMKFGESIYNYLGKDGKTSGCLPILLFSIIASSFTFFL